MPLRYSRSAALIVALAFTSGAIATTANDAGSGADAGNNRGLALALAAFGSYEGALGADDVDWYKRVEASSGPSCVSATVTPSSDVLQALRVGNATATRTLQLSAPAGTTTKGGLAIDGLERTLLGLSGAPSTYSFALSHSKPTLSGDGSSGRDAGATLVNAVPIGAGCTSGSLHGALLDHADVYAIELLAGETLYYSLASSASSFQVALSDSAGQLLGPVTTAGETVGVYIPSDGTFYLTASTSSESSLMYFLGVVEGPDPSGPGCRPYCFVST